MATTVKTPYTGARRLISPQSVPTWLNEYDASRLATYNLYEDIYWTEPDTFKLTQRGSEENPIYIPSGRIICNTIDRYTGVDWTPYMDPAYGSETEQAEALMAMTDLMRRCKMGTQYDSNKLYGSFWGDWCFYITANTGKAQGTRIDIKAINPRMVFPIDDDEDVDRVMGYDLIEEIRIGSDTRIKRTRYLKSESLDYPFGNAGIAGGPVSYQVDVLEVQDWEDPEKAKVVKSDDTVPPTALPTNIIQLPVYHIKNFEEPQNPFGISELRGIERLMAAVNQSITDEELALALHGLGMYKSGKGQPIDPVTKQPTNWKLGPGRVVHDETFAWVTSNSSVSPSQDHLKYLHNQMDEVYGLSDAAKGTVDVSVAESGVALAFRMAPILSATKRKDTVIREKMDQMLFDLREWFKAYEGVDMTNVRFNSGFGEKLPKNVEAEFQRLLAMYTNKLITAAYFRDGCRELGMKIPMNVTGAAIAAEQAAMNAAVDPYADRLAQEAGVDDPAPDDASVDDAVV